MIGRPLRSRLAFTLMGLSFLAASALGGIYLLTEHMIEEDALRREMIADMAVLLESARVGPPAPVLPTTLRFFPAGEVPAELTAVSPGSFRRMRHDGRSVQVLAERHGHGTAVLVHDLTLVERRERLLLGSLLAGVIISAAAAWWASGGLARRILLPLTGLVEEIRRIDPLAPAQHPVSRTGVSDLDAIPDAVNGLIGELDHVLSRERAFADAASHELRTPLAVVRGAIDVLRERGGAPPPVVDRIDRAVRRAQEDLEALLALSPAREPAPPRPVELRELLPAAAEPWVRASGEGPRIAWDWRTSGPVEAEPAALAIIFTNLLRNALRAAPRGEVRIEVEDGCLRVVDDGEGLPPGWPADAEPRGRGLGLLIARTLAERHGWRLAVEPAAPRGTRATLHLRDAGDLSVPGPPGTWRCSPT